MTYDEETSELVLVFLTFVLNHWTRQPSHMGEFYEKNEHIIAPLTDEDKETLRGVYRETQDRLRKAG